MAYWRKKRTDITAKIPFPRVPSPAQISSYIKKVVRAARGEFYEMEALEVTKTLLDSWGQGAVLGTFINNPDQEILGGGVLPLFPNIKHIPLIGEHVAVIEFNEQHYYTGVINRKNSINENSIPGIATAADGRKLKRGIKFGKTFTRGDIRPPDLNEGEIVYSGRFGQSIKFGCNPENNKPIIKISCGQPELNEEQKNEGYGTPLKQNIEFDGSSIYLVDSGLPYDATTNIETFDGVQINDESPKILIKSGQIYMSVKGALPLIRINVPAGQLNIDAYNFYTENEIIKIGGRAGNVNLQPVVKGDDLKTFLTELVDEMLSDINATYEKSATLAIATTGMIPSIAPFKVGIETIKIKLKTKIKTAKILSEYVQAT
jgi:hypothetical protein